jgi:hypothetical protein
MLQRHNWVGQLLLLLPIEIFNILLKLEGQEVKFGERRWGGEKREGRWLHTSKPSAGVEIP